MPGDEVSLVRYPWGTKKIHIFGGMSWGISKNDGFTMENPIEIDDFIQEWWFYHGKFENPIEIDDFIQEWWFYHWKSYWNRWFYPRMMVLQWTIPIQNLDDDLGGTALWLRLKHQFILLWSSMTHRLIDHWWWSWWFIVVPKNDWLRTPWAVCELEAMAPWTNG